VKLSRKFKVYCKPGAEYMLVPRDHARIFKNVPRRWSNSSGNSFSFANSSKERRTSVFRCNQISTVDSLNDMSASTVFSILSLFPEPPVCFVFNIASHSSHTSPRSGRIDRIPDKCTTEPRAWEQSLRRACDTLTEDLDASVQKRSSS
jgi:hypothetical protein